MRKTNIFAALLMMGALSGAEAAPILIDNSGSEVIEGGAKKQDAVKPEELKTKLVKEKNRFGGFSGGANPYKHHRKASHNQRQLRKFLRQCPHQRKKYGK